MTIFFVDDKIDVDKDSFKEYGLNINTLPIKIIDAGNGYSQCIEDAEEYKELNIPVLTNAPYLLSSDYCWNEKTNTFDCFILDSYGAWRNLQSLTDKELRKPHNIEKMWRAGAFNIK